MWPIGCTYIPNAKRGSHATGLSRPPCNQSEQSIHSWSTQNHWPTGSWRIHCRQSHTDASLTSFIDSPSTEGIVTVVKQCRIWLDWRTENLGMVTVLVWAPTLTGSRVVLYSDDQSTVSFLTKCTTKNIAAIAWLKKLFYASSKHNFDVTACHISGANNVLPDALTRLVESQSHMRMSLTDFPYSLPWSDLPINSFSYPFVTSAKDSRQATSQRDG